MRAVIFDMDGVLTDSEPLINAAAIAMFKELGLAAAPEDFIPFIGAGEDRYLGGVAEKHGFPIDLPAAKKRTYEIYLGLVPEKLEAYPGARELVLNCRAAGLLLAVASSADRIKVEANLRKIGLPAHQWHAVITGEDVIPKKPAPDIFLAAAQNLGVTAADCTVVEDAVNGVQAAKAAGMRCVAVAQTFPGEKLAAADLVRPDIASVTLEDLTPAPLVKSLPGPTAGTPPPPIGPLEPPVIPDYLSQATPVSLPSRHKPVWGFWSTLALGAAIFLAFSAVQLGVAFLYVVAHAVISQGRVPTGIDSDGLMLALATLAACPVVVLLCWLFARVKTPQVPAYLGLVPVTGRQLFLWTVPVAALLVASDLLTYALGRPLVPEFMMQVYRTAKVLPLLWLALVLAAPISEELLFRGFLFPGLAQSAVGVPGAIILPSILWAAIHLQYDFYGIATIFVGGLLLGYARHKTGSVYPPMLLHGLMNLAGTLEAEYFLRTG